MPGQRRRRQTWAVRNRDSILFTRDTVFTAFGLWIIYHEIWQSPEPNQVALAVALVLCGLPVALRLDQILKSKDRNGEK
jgi:hypothetical protein